VKYFIIAGEASGDLHASNLVTQIRHLDPTAEIRGMGGPLMARAGVDCVVDYSDYSFMGLIEVVQNLGKIRRLFHTIKHEITTWQPDKVLLVDYGGFNLKIAKFCKRLGVQTHFYILPKVWAWNEKRVVKIRDNVDFGYCIFPFEEDYFTGHGVNAQYVGNPVVEQIQNYLKENDNLVRQDYIALLPGSRNQEIKYILPIMIAYAETRKDLSFVVAMHNKKLFEGYVFPDNIRISENDTYTIVALAKAAIVTSGTANLETALLNTPQVVCYKANAISYAIGKRLVKIKYVSPVNLILDKLVIPELLQDTFNVVHLGKEVNALLSAETADRIRTDYSALWKTLGSSSAALNTAKQIVNK
jgi:lipid-A-disaccharide synthase